MWKDQTKAGAAPGIGHVLNGFVGEPFLAFWVLFVCANKIPSVFQKANWTELPSLR